MAVIGTIRVANLTPFARAQIITTNMPLDEGFCRDGAIPRLVAKSAYNGADVPIQVMKPARNSLGNASVPLYPDGSWRIARFAFPVTLPAGGSNVYGYDAYTERDIVIETGSLPLPQFTIHPDLDLAKLLLRWECWIFDPERQPSPEDDPSVDPSLRSQQRSVDFSATAGRITQHIPPYAVSTPAAVEEWDTAQTPTLEGWIHAFRVSGRIMPEEFGGAPVEPSTYATWIYEVPNGALDGCGRMMRWWLECGHALVTPDDEARSFSGQTHGYLWNRPWLRFRRSDSTVAWAVQVDQGDIWTARQENYPGGTCAVSPIDPGDPLSRAQYLPWCYSLVRRGMLLARGDDTFTSLETSTWSAIQYRNGAHATIDGLSLDWKRRQENYGPYGVAMRWDEFGFDSEQQMRTLQAQSVRSQIDRYSRQGAYDGYPEMVNVPASASGSDHPNFAAFGLQQHLSCNHPDFRDAWLGLQTDAHRGQTWRNVDCEPVNFRHDFDASQRPARLYSGKILFDGQNVDQMIGLPYAVHGGVQDRAKSTLTPSAFQSGTGFIDLDAAHVDFGHTYAFVTLTGDRWFVGRRVLDCIQHSLNHKQISLRDSGGYSPSSFSAHGFGNPRSEGRVARCRAQAFAWTHDDDVAMEMAKRADAAFRYNRDGDPDGFYQGWADNVASALVKDTGYFSIACHRAPDRSTRDPQAGYGGYGAFGLGLWVWDHVSDRANEAGYSPFQQGINAEGMFLVWKMLDRHGGYPTETGYALDLARKLCKGTLMVAWRTLPGGGVGNWFAFDMAGTGFGPVPIEMHSQSTRYYNANGTLQPTDWYGPEQTGVAVRTQSGAAPNSSDPNGGMPIWRYPRSDFVPYVAGPGMISAVILSPDDPEVQERAAYIFRDNTPWNLEFIRNRLGNYTNNYYDLLPVVDNPYLRWADYGGSRTFDEVTAARIEVRYYSLDTSTDEQTKTAFLQVQVTAQEEIADRLAESAAAVITLTAGGQETAVIVRPETAAAVVTITAGGDETVGAVTDVTADVVVTVSAGGTEVIRTPTVPVLEGITATASIGIVAELGEPSQQWDESTDVILFAGSRSYDAVDRLAVAPTSTVTVADDGTLTIDEAIGPNRVRSRNVTLFRDVYGNPRRSTQPGPWRGPEPTRRTYEPDAMLDDA